MFKKTTAGMVVLTFLTKDAKAMKLRYRPIEGTVPWHKNVENNSWVDPDWPVGYFVPDFGVDEDIKASLKNTKDTEKSLKKTLNADWSATTGEPRNYVVPNFGVDEDMKNVRAAWTSAETKLGKTLTASFGDKDGVPRGYFVPNFGVDEDMKAVKNSIDVTEKKLGKKFKADFGATAAGVNPRGYTVPNFGQDEDILNVQKVIKQSETKLGHSWKPVQDGNGFWVMPSAINNKSYTYAAQVSPPNSQTIQLDSDPICSSAGCTQYKHPEQTSHPMDYPVPDFGVDHDIKDSAANEQVASKVVGHTWVWQKGKPRGIVQYEEKPLDVDMQDSISHLGKMESQYGAWELPAAVQLEADVQVESDPICSSAGCTQYKHKQVEGHPMDYFVPNFGKDQDMLDSVGSESIASQQLGHTWVWKKAEPAPARGYTVPNFGVDEDILSTQKNLKDAGGANWEFPKDGVDWVQLKSDIKSDPICSSAGCTQFKHPGAAPGHPVDYPVPDLGQDTEITASLNNEKLASKMVGSEWKFKTAETKGKWENPAKKVDYNFAPSLDSDIQDTMRHFGDLGGTY